MHNCPADSAFSEAKDIWRDKQCDILLSLGTGIILNRSPSDLRRPLGAVQVVAGNMTDATKAWGKFVNDRPQSQNLFRLDPIYRGVGFGLDDVKKLKVIQKQTEEWLLTKEKEISHICDRLIAALFFFRPSSETYDGLQVGEILCRLPTEEGQKLAVGILRKTDPIFKVKCNDEIFKINAKEAFSNLRSTGELRLEVTSGPAVSTIGDIKIAVMMQSTVVKYRWLPISGSPYIIRADVN